MAAKKTKRTTKKATTKRAAKAKTAARAASRAGKRHAAPKKAAPKPKKKPAPKKRAELAPVEPPPGLSEQPFSTNDPIAAYEHFAAELGKLPASDVPVHGGSVEIALHNVRRAVSSMVPLASQIPFILPTVDATKLLELPALALALVFADGKVPREQASTTEIEAALERVTRPRELTHSFLEIGGELGLVNAKRVADIRAGHGKLDKAQDCVDIAGVFRDYESVLAGKHPFAHEMLRDLEETGTWLLAHLSAKGTAKDVEERHPAAVMRDRFWQALEDRYEELRQVAVAIWGVRQADDHVPPLQSRLYARAAGVGAPDETSRTAARPATPDASAP